MTVVEPQKEAALASRFHGPENIINSAFKQILLPHFPRHRPYAGIFSLFVLFLSVKQQLVIFFVLFCPCNSLLLSSLFCFVRATDDYPFLISTYVLLQPFLSDLLA